MMPANPRRATTLEDATAELAFEYPLEAGDERYVDLGPARGGVTTAELETHLRRLRGGTTQPIAFLSHRGGGKSTELNRLAGSVEDRYFTLSLTANAEMDTLRIEAEDLLLVLARTVEERMRAIGKPLPSELLTRVSAWFSQEIVEDEEILQSARESKQSAELAGTIPNFAKLLFQLTELFKVESNHREKIRSELKKFPGTLLTSVNLLFDAANELLKPSNRELLVIVDNLDRYEPDRAEELLVKSADRLRKLRCRLIVTPPISLHYAANTRLNDAYSCWEMPSVRLRSREETGQPFSGPGRGLLLAALDKRIDLDRLIPEKVAQDRLVVASGGSIRDLIELAHEGTLLARGDVISTTDVDRVVVRRRGFLRDLIDANNWWEALRAVHRTKRRDHSDACNAMLYRRLVFYYNEGGWYDIHPLIPEMPEFHSP